MLNNIYNSVVWLDWIYILCMRGLCARERAVKDEID